MKNKIRTLWKKLPTAVRAGWNTAWVTFLGLMVTILTGLLPQLINAISTKNFEPFYDSLNLAMTSALSAVSALVVGCLNVLFRTLKPIEDAY